MIIAVDFDGILCENKFPEIGPPNYEVISLVRELIDRGHEVILWTTRNGEELTAAVDWCGDRGLHFCNVNGPAPSNLKEYKNVYERESRKVFADIYIDDHNIEFVGRRGNKEVGKKQLLNLLKEGVKTWETEEN